MEHATATSTLSFPALMGSRSAHDVFVPNKTPRLAIATAGGRTFTAVQGLKEATQDAAEFETHVHGTEESQGRAVERPHLHGLVVTWPPTLSASHQWHHRRRYCSRDSRYPTASAYFR